MKKMLFIIMICAFPASVHAADVGVSISVGQPGFYGRIDIGDVPRPVLINPRPIIVLPPPGHVSEEPLYLRVPPGHQKKWKKHCAQYGACGRPVHFVSDKWYNDVYVPQYQDRHGHGQEGGRGSKGDGHQGGRERGDRGGREDREQGDRGERGQGRHGR